MTKNPKTPPSSKTDPTDIGANRTGIATARSQAKEMIEAAKKAVPSTSDGAQLEKVRADFCQAAPPVGTIAPRPR